MPRPSRSISGSSSSTGSPRTDRHVRVVLLGHGISYSSSPAMQTAAFRAAGLDWTYELADVAADRLAEAVGALRGPGAAVTFVARRREAVGAGLRGRVVAWSERWEPLARHADVVVNATPLGRRGEMPMRPAYLPVRGAVIDLVYVEGGTPLVRRARHL